MNIPVFHAARQLRGISWSAWIPILPFAIPALLLPPLAGMWWQSYAPASFAAHQEGLLTAFLAYIVVVRFALLDLMLFYISRKHRSVRLDLLHIVLLYLEVSAITLLYFALLFHLFGVFELFRYNGALPAPLAQGLAHHAFSVALYISLELFTTLGLGDWVPQTLNAMWAASIETLLGFVQGGVFFAVLIYGHQNLTKAP
jgi:hypothetical protein